MWHCDCAIAQVPMTACICRNVNNRHLEDLRQLLRFMQQSSPSDCELEAVCAEAQHRMHQVHLDCEAEWTDQQKELAAGNYTTSRTIILHNYLESLATQQILCTFISQLLPDGEGLATLGALLIPVGCCLVDQNCGKRKKSKSQKVKSQKSKSQKSKVKSQKSKSHFFASHNFDQRGSGQRV